METYVLVFVLFISYAFYLNIDAHTGVNYIYIYRTCSLDSITNIIMASDIREIGDISVQFLTELGTIWDASGVPKRRSFIKSILAERFKAKELYEDKSSETCGKILIARSNDAVGFKQLSRRKFIDAFLYRDYTEREKPSVTTAAIDNMRKLKSIIIDRNMGNNERSRAVVAGMSIPEIYLLALNTVDYLKYIEWAEVLVQKYGPKLFEKDVTGLKSKMNTHLIFAATLKLKTVNGERLAVSFYEPHYNRFLNFATDISNENDNIISSSQEAAIRAHEDEYRRDVGSPAGDRNGFGGEDCEDDAEEDVEEDVEEEESSDNDNDDEEEESVSKRRKSGTPDRSGGRTPKSQTPKSQTHKSQTPRSQIHKSQTPKMTQEELANETRKVISQTAISNLEEKFSGTVTQSADDGNDVAQRELRKTVIEPVINNTRNNVAKDVCNVESKELFDNIPFPLKDLFALNAVGSYVMKSAEVIHNSQVTQYKGCPKHTVMHKIGGPNSEHPVVQMCARLRDRLVAFNIIACNRINALVEHISYLSDNDMKTLDKLFNKTAHNSRRCPKLQKNKKMNDHICDIDCENAMMLSIGYINGFDGTYADEVNDDAIDLNLSQTDRVNIIMSKNKSIKDPNQKDVYKCSFPKTGGVSSQPICNTEGVPVMNRANLIDNIAWRASTSRTYDNATCTFLTYLLIHGDFTVHEINKFSGVSISTLSHWRTAYLWNNKKLDYLDHVDELKDTINRKVKNDDVRDKLLGIIDTDIASDNIRHYDVISKQRQLVKSNKSYQKKLREFVDKYVIKNIDDDPDEEYADEDASFFLDSTQNHMQLADTSKYKIVDPTSFVINTKKRCKLAKQVDTAVPKKRAPNTKESKQTAENEARAGAIARVGRFKSKKSKTT